MKNRILFVDDEINILKGLRRMLRSMRQEWEMVFVDSGEKALDLMQNMSFDVVVSDMRMPNMDGATLLKHVRHNQPKAVRIILSGFSEEEAILHTVGPAHQYLAKPCEATVLVNTITRALKLRRFLDRNELCELVSGLDHLPSPPDVYARLLFQLDSPLSASVDIADTIGEDLAMTTQILKLTNSAYFALPQKIDDINHAVRLLGVDTIKALVLIAGFFQKFSGNADIAVLIKTLSRRCLSVGIAAKAIATAENFPVSKVGQACSAGVLAHIGTLVLMSNLPTQFNSALKKIDDEHINILESEQQIFGATHPEVGAYLLGLWGFSDPISEAVAYHHTPKLMTPHDRFSVVNCVYIAQHLLKTVNSSTSPKEISDGAGLDMAYLREIGLDDRVPLWIDLVLKLKETVKKKEE